MNKLHLVLIIVALFLVIPLIWSSSNLTGGLMYSLDSSEPVCTFSDSGELHEIPTELCCYEIQAQLMCQAEGKNFRCFVAENSERFYQINHKMLNYCVKEGYDVKVE